jgi:hypothetical protein
MRAMKKGLMLAMAFIVLMLVMSASSFSYTYKGRVVDAETKEPIEGAVVVAHWNKEKGYFIETVQYLKDVKETLTDKNGEWKIKGPKGHVSGDPLYVIVSHIPFVYYTLKPNFIVFKPGYCSWPRGFGIAACGGLKPGGRSKIIEGETIELPRLTAREDRLKAKPGIVKGDNGARKQKTYIKLLNEENRYLGLGEYRYDFLKEDNNK